ncbi:MAG: NADH-quinone oxidoreductase subunit L [Nitrospirae bacterium RBG_13_39_12]|nr:MAG: NADH-quinone oxidoreductase subunit L [Nitrospirae bacterium RBG_13_39_12]
MELQFYHVLIPTLPLIGFLINILLGKEVTRYKAHWPAVLSIAGSWVCALFTLRDVMAGKIIDADLYTWMVSGTFKVSVGFLIDPLTAVMLIVVTTCGTLIHIYAVGYMHGDTGYYRFFAYLNLFCFFMLMLVMGNNFLLLYLGWEGVGLCSYFLIGYFFHKKAAADAGKKAFIVNRFGDFGFGLGVFMVFLTFGTLHYADVFSNVSMIAGQTVNFLGFNVDLPTLIALLLFCGAIGKSAQIPLHVWLPDAMEGPTPVSALIHAATMVTAGVFMVARCNPIFNLSEVAMSTVGIIGALTMFFAATIAIVQNDIKRIIAYSTCSHLGYMFIACGMGAYAAGIFHLYTHAFFKALLFLAAGSVIHAVHTNNIQEMGGLKKYLPITYAVFVIGGLSAGGFPGLSGFFSKDEIIWSAYAAHSPVGKFVWVLGLAGAFFTPFYTFRLIFLTFHGKNRGAHHGSEHGHGGGHDSHGAHQGEHHIHESPKVMTIPLMFLALGAVAAGWVGIPPLLGGGAHFAEFLKPVVGHPEFHASHAEEWGVMALSTSLVVIGLGLSAFLYLRQTDLPKRIAQQFSFLYKVLYNKYYVDELYNYTIIKPTLWIAQKVLVGVTDAKIIEGIVNGVPGAIGQFSQKLRKIQTGLTQHYAIIMAAGAVFVIIIAIFLR